MEKLINVFKALSDETRLRILMALYYNSHCVCELTEILNESQPKISKHLALLKSMGLVETSRKSQFIYYQLMHNEILLHTLNFIMQNINQYPIFLKDQQNTAHCAINKGNNL